MNPVGLYSQRKLHISKFSDVQLSQSSQRSFVNELCTEPEFLGTLQMRQMPPCKRMHSNIIHSHIFIGGQAVVRTVASQHDGSGHMFKGQVNWHLGLQA